VALVVVLIPLLRELAVLELAIIVMLMVITVIGPVGALLICFYQRGHILAFQRA